MAGLLTNSERQIKRDEVKARNTQAMAQFASLYAKKQGGETTHAANHWAQAEKLGLPEFRHEDWQYTPLTNVLAKSYHHQAVAIDSLPAEMMNIEAYRLVLIDGRYSPALSDIDLGPFHISLLDSQSILPAAIKGEVFLHLTESLAEQPVMINVANHVIGDKPLYIVNISSGSKEEQQFNQSHYRYHLDIGANSQVSVIEHFISMDKQHHHMSGGRLSAHIGANADFRHLKLGFENNQSYHFAHNDLVVERDARVNSTSFLLGGALTRHNSSVQLNGENVTLSLNSLLLPCNGEIADTRTYLEHNNVQGESRQLHKIIVMDNSKAVFNGMIKVAPKALKTDGQMTNNTLLLGERAEIDTKPQLEIYADDVKCGHGATVGRIDEEQLFYLRSRGISHEDANHMIIFAFAAQLTQAIDDEIINAYVIEHIRSRLAKI